MIDGDPSDWAGIEPLSMDSQDLYDEGFPQPTADLKEVYLTRDLGYLFFMVRFWGNVNLDTDPEEGERVTSLYIRIISSEVSSEFLIWIHPLWGELWRFLSGDFDNNGDFEEESDRIQQVEMGASADVIETGVPLHILYQYGFSSPETLMVEFYSAAWHPLRSGGYGGVFDGTNQQWWPVSKEVTTTASTRMTTLLSTTTTERLVVAVPPLTMESVLASVLISLGTGLLIAFATRRELRQNVKQAFRRLLGRRRTR